MTGVPESRVQILNSAYQNYLAAGGTVQTAGNFAGAEAALAANEIPNSIIGVGGPFILTAPASTATVGDATVAIAFSGKAFYISSAPASSGLTVGYGS